MAATALTRNALSLIFSGQLQPTGQTSVVLQILKVSEMSGVCYLVLSDGANHATSVLNNPVQQFQKLDIVELQAWGFVQSERGLLLQVHNPVTIAAAPTIIGSPEALPPLQGLQPPAAAMPQQPNPYAAPQQQGPNPYAAQTGQTPAWQAQGGFQTPDKPQAASRRGQHRVSENMAAAAAARATTFPILPISQLTPYVGQWRIRVRLVGKSDVRTFVNSRGEGKLLNFEVIDEEGTETRVVAFGAAVDKFNALLSPKGIYDIAGGRVKPGNPRFSPHAVEITLDENSSSITAVDDNGLKNFPHIKYDFVPIARLPEVHENVRVDIGAVVYETWEPSTTTRQNGQVVKRWPMKILDASGPSCVCTLWGGSAEVPLEAGSVIFIRRARVREFRGRTVESGDGSFVEVDPDHEYAFQLRRWYNEQRDKSALPVSLGAASGPLRFLGEIYVENQLMKEGAATGNRSQASSRVAPVTIVSIPHDRPVYYMSCNEEVPSIDGKSMRRCARKTLPTGDGWQCSVGHSCATASARYILRVTLADATFGSFYTTFFDQEAQTLLGISAQDMADLYTRAEQGENGAYNTIEEIFKRATWGRWAVQLKSRMEEYEGKLSVKSTVSECTPNNYSKQAQEMLAEVKEAIMPGTIKRGA